MKDRSRPPTIPVHPDRPPPRAARVARRAAAALFAALGPWSPLPEVDAAQCDPQEIAKLLPAEGAAEDGFGWSVALSGDTALVGSHQDDTNGEDAGSAYVFQREESGPGWSVVAKLLASDGSDGDEFGEAVALDGNLAVVGAWHSISGGPGAAYVFYRDKGGPNQWGQVRRLASPDPPTKDLFGRVVAIRGDTLLVGATNATGAVANSGAAYLFERNLGGQNSWGLSRKIYAADGEALDSFGSSVALSEDTALVGAIWDDDRGSNAGAAYLFGRDQGGPANWGALVKLTASDGSSGDIFGQAVALEGTTAWVGAPWDDDDGQGSGSAYVFERDLGGVGNWGEAAKHTASDATAGDQFGFSLALSGGTTVIGAWNDDEHGTSAGSAYLFRLEPGSATWTEAAKFAPADIEPHDWFATSVSVSGGMALVGSPRDDDNGIQAGAAYLWEEPGPVESYCTAGTSASGCQALLAASGSPSATAPSGFVLQAASIEGQKSGLFFFGTGGRQANPWGNGTSYQCVVPPVVRGGLLPDSGGTAGQCDGALAQDLNALWCPGCPKPAKNPGAGALVQAQLWYRDPLSTSNQTTSLSDALEFSVCP